MRRKQIWGSPGDFLLPWKAYKSRLSRASHIWIYEWILNRNICTESLMFTFSLIIFKMDQQTLPPCPPPLPPPPPPPKARYEFSGWKCCSRREQRFRPENSYLAPLGPGTSFWAESAVLSASSVFGPKTRTWVPGRGQGRGQGMDIILVKRQQVAPFPFF